MASSSSLNIKRFEKENRATSNAFESCDKESEEELVREPPFRGICTKAAELEAYRNSDRNEDEDKVHKDVHMYVEEEMRKQNQARCASILARNTATRLLGDCNSGTKGVSEYLESLWQKSNTKDDSDEKTHTVVKLTGVTIYPKVDGQGGDTIVGTLEAHSDRFIYKTSTSYFHSELSYEYDNVKELFFQVEDDNKEMMSDKGNILPLLHFRLHQPIQVGTEKRDHIQFRLVPTTAGENCGRSKDLKYFIGKVGEIWWGICPPFSFSQVFKRGEFHGVLPNKNSPDNFIFTYSSILQLQSTSFVVVGLQEIEFVHLAILRPEEVDMTVVFTDLNRPVLQISSIPLKSLEDIKKKLDGWDVKFFENNLYLDWGSIVRNIAENPEKFIQEGGWNAYELEDSATSLYYKHYYLELSQAPVIKSEDRVWG